MSDHEQVLGVSLGSDATRFALHAALADRVELCLFDDNGGETRLDLKAEADARWALEVPGIDAGQRYGFRVHGPWDPQRGHLCDPAALLLDPYALAIDGDVAPHDAVYAHTQGVETAPFVPRSIVVDRAFDWSGDERPHIPASDRVIYEAHVKGLTRSHPAVPPDLRGTYAGVAYPAVVEHLVELGITTIELMPIHHFVHGRFLHERGLRNYWGYDSISFFAPHAEYAMTSGGGQVDEFKAMVRALHGAGLEVFLDVVYNHTAEGDHRGPTLTFRGLDDGASYISDPDDRRHLLDFTGTGNTVDMRQPSMHDVVLDSLRYWTSEMHIDGFRFDLATALARTDSGFDQAAPFIEAVRHDAALQDVTLIAEPWDTGPEGFQLGGFPAPWAEWNGRYRDTVRDFWRGSAAALPDLGRRLTGSADLFAAAGRGPLKSINYVTTHDGFTLADLVSYDHKHNEVNGEDSADGEDDNRSWNGGTEGPTDDPDVQTLRARQQRNLLATLFLSQGTPMLLGGDEVGRSQGGNNNAYCQDNETSWTNWANADTALLDFVRGLAALRREHRGLRLDEWLAADLPADADSASISWHRPDGQPMLDADWHADPARLGILLHGEERLYIALNPASDEQPFRMPGHGRWAALLDTASADPFRTTEPTIDAGITTARLRAHSLALFRGSD